MANHVSRLQALGRGSVHRTTVIPQGGTTLTSEMDNILVVVDSMVVILNMVVIHNMVDFPMVIGIAHMVTGIAHMVTEIAHMVTGIAHMVTGTARMVGMDHTMAETRMTQEEDQLG